MHVAHFSLQEFSDEPIQSLMIVRELSLHCCCVSDPKFSSSLLAAAVGTGGPFLSISFEERTQTPPASSPTSVLIPLYSPLRTLLSVLQCRHHYQTDSSPVLAALRSGATCARSSAASSCHTGSRTAALAARSRGDDGDPHCWSGKEGGGRAVGHASASAPAADARSRASANLHEMNMISVSRSRSAGSRWIMGCRNICSTVPDGREVVRKRHKITPYAVISPLVPRLPSAGSPSHLLA